MDKQWRVDDPYVSPYDPCPPSKRYFIVPPNQYIVFQPKGLKQFSPREALHQGTLWPNLCSPYNPPHKRGE
jgi:spore coat protein JA